MRTGLSRRCVRALAAPVAIVASLAMASAAQAGAGYTTINSSSSGDPLPLSVLCHNGNPNVNCDQYGAKAYVWINGGPNGTGLPDGTWFFSVLVPGNQLDPNDRPPNTFPKARTDGNLSDDFDPYTNRTFTITNGEISSYSGTHRFGVDT